MAWGSIWLYKATMEVQYLEVRDTSNFSACLTHALKNKYAEVHALLDIFTQQPDIHAYSLEVRARVRARTEN